MLNTPPLSLFLRGHCQLQVKKARANLSQQRKWHEQTHVTAMMLMMVL